MDSLIARIICTMALISCLTLPALADSVAYSDLGTGGSFDGNTSWVITGLTSTNKQYEALADLFTASIGGALSHIDLALANFGGTNSDVISVYTDVANNLGTLLFQGTVSSPSGAGSATPLTTLIASSGVLVAGDSYFLVVAPGAADTYDGWYWNNTGTQGAMLVDHGSGFGDAGPNTFGAFDVKVIPSAAVPEPSTWLMLGAEAISLLALVSLSGRFRLVLRSRRSAS